MCAGAPRHSAKYQQLIVRYVVAPAMWPKAPTPVVRQPGAMGVVTESEIFFSSRRTACHSAADKPGCCVMVIIYQLFAYLYNIS